jgi:hypothetical protein
LKNIGAEAVDHWRLTKRTGNLSSALEKADSQREQIFKCRLVSWQGTPIDIFSLIMFHLTHVVYTNDDMSSEEHFTNLRASRGSYF